MANVGDTYTGDAGAIQANIDRLTGQLTSSINGAPQVKTAMGESLAQTEGAIPVLASKRSSLIEELFKHDQNFAQKYATPDSPTYVENPVAREQGLQSATAATWGGISGLGTQISSRQKLIGDALDRGMSLYNAGVQAKQIELDTLQKQLDRLDAKNLKQQELDARKAEADASVLYTQKKDAEDQRRWEAEFALKQAQAAGKTAELPVEARKMQSEVEQAHAVVNELDRLSQKGSLGALGIAAQPLAMAPGSPFFKDIVKLNAARSKYALQVQTLTGMGTQGIMGAKLLAELKDVLPSATDSEDNRQMKIDLLRQSVANKAETLYTMYGVVPSFNPYAFAGVLKPEGTGMASRPVQTAKTSPLGPEWVPVP